MTPQLRRAIKLLQLSRLELVETVGVLDPTISRVTANNYLASPRGTFTLRYFFSNGVAGVAGGVRAAQSIHH